MFARDTEPAFVADGVVRLGTRFVNWYLVEEDGRVTIVDAGMPGYRAQLDRGLAFLGRRRSDVAAVVLTHGHPDHIGVAEYVRGALGVPVYVHRDDVDLAKTGRRVGRAEGSMLPYLRYAHAWRLIAHFMTVGVKPANVHEVTAYEDGDELDVPGRPRVVHTPGHTAGHCALHLESRRALVVGDLLCSQNPLTGARGPQLMPRALNRSTGTILDSLSNVEQLEAEVVLFGHGEPWREGIASAVRRARETGVT
jgi:glyoxylase-like metal-dependent hydrolase (beta-lactamase superfamily II)